MGRILAAGKGDAPVIFALPSRHAAPADRLRDRRRLLRDRRRQGAARARLRVRLLRGVGPRRRQLGVREPQRDVGRLPLAAHQHVARADGVRGLPDAGDVSRLPAPHAHRGVLRRLRRPLRAPRPDHVRDAASRTPSAARRRRLGRHDRAGRDAHVRRAGRRQRPPLGPALAGAGVPRARPLRRRRRCTRTRTRARTRRCSATATSSCSGWATRRWTSRSSRRSSRAARTSPRGAGRGSSRSTCSAGRSTR